MPFTPFHFGPGLLLKGIAPSHISLASFALANIAMDIEPLLRLLAGSSELHGPSHTLLGAALLGAATATLFPKLGPAAWACYRRLHPQADAIYSVTPRQAWSGALLGSFSHILLDAPMHFDMQPLLPLSAGNPWLNPPWTQHIYLACVLSGMLGLLLSLLRLSIKPKQLH